MTRVALFSGGEMILYARHGAQLPPPLTFGATAAGYADFAACLHSHPRSPIQLLIDVTEEEFREQATPCVYGGERRELWRARGRRLFGDASYHYAKLQGREIGGRRDDRVLFSAINRAEQWLSPWLSAIAEQDIPLIGISSLPLLTTQLLRWLRIDSEQALLISLQRSGNLRQSFFQQRQLKVSRLAIRAHLPEITLAAFVQHELGSIRHYLHRSKLIASDTRLAVYVLANQTLYNALTAPASTPRNLDRMQCVLLDVAPHVQRLAKRLRLHVATHAPASNGSAADTGSGDAANMLFALWACKKGVRNHYASTQQRYRYRLAQIKRGLLVGACMVLLGSLGYGAWQTLLGLRLESAAAALKDKVASHSTRYQQLKSSLPPIPLPSIQLQEVVQLARRLEQQRDRADPLRMMQIISRGVAATDGLDMQRLTWTVSSDTASKLLSATATKAPSSTPAASSAGAAAGAPPLYLIAVIEGEVNAEIDYPLAVERVIHFAAVLRALPEVASVAVLSLPFSLDTPRAESSGAGRSRFKVQLALRAAAAPPGAASR